jgi:ABC-type cobalamin transport system ATPase subunit
MGESDLVLRLERSLPGGEWNRVAQEMTGVPGVRAVGPVARPQGRLLHVRYDPAHLAPSGVAEAAGALGHSARVAAL